MNNVNASIKYYCAITVGNISVNTWGSNTKCFLLGWNAFSGTPESCSIVPEVVLKTICFDLMIKEALAILWREGKRKGTPFSHVGLLGEKEKTNVWKEDCILVWMINFEVLWLKIFFSFYVTFVKLQLAGII